MIIYDECDRESIEFWLQRSLLHFNWLLPVDITTYILICGRSYHFPYQKKGGRNFLGWLFGTRWLGTVSTFSVIPLPPPSVLQIKHSNNDRSQNILQWTNEQECLILISGFEQLFSLFSSLYQVVYYEWRVGLKIGRRKLSKIF